MPQTGSVSTDRVPTMKHEKGQRHDAPCSSFERPLTWPVRDKRKDKKGRAVQSQRQLKLSTARVGHHFWKLTSRRCADGLYTPMVSPLQRRWRFDSSSFRLFYTLWGQRKQVFAAPIAYFELLTLCGSQHAVKFIGGEPDGKHVCLAFFGRHLRSAPFCHVYPLQNK